MGYPRNSFILCHSTKHTYGIRIAFHHEIDFLLIFTSIGWNRLNDDCRLGRTKQKGQIMHDHEHEHGHEDAHAPITNTSGASHYEKRATAIVSLLISKGLVTADEVRRTIEQM